MIAQDSIVQWMEMVREGNEKAAQVLWNRYFEDLVRLAKSRLKTAPYQLDDGDDVALSVMRNFFSAIKCGRILDLQDKLSIWRLLSKMTRQKIVDRIRRATSIKAGGEFLIHNSAPIRTGDSRGDSAVDIPDAGTTPHTVAVLREQIELLLDALDRRGLRLKELALLKMKGYTNRECALGLQCSVKAIEWKLKLIRAIGKDIMQEPP